MAEATGEALQNKSILGPGESGNFVYVGEMIPNQVNISNRNEFGPAEYSLESGQEGWKFFGTVPTAGESSILVQWFNGFATFHNLSREADIEIGGNGIFPQGEEPE